MGTSGQAPSVENWDIRRAEEADWIPWGSGGTARAKILGEGDGYVVALVEAGAGYSGTPHDTAMPSSSTS